MSVERSEEASEGERWAKEDGEPCEGGEKTGSEGERERPRRAEEEDEEGGEGIESRKDRPCATTFSRDRIMSSAWAETVRKTTSHLSSFSSSPRTCTYDSIADQLFRPRREEENGRVERTSASFCAASQSATASAHLCFSRSRSPRSSVAVSE